MVNAASVPYFPRLVVLLMLFAQSCSTVGTVLLIVTYRLDVNIPEVALVTIWSDMSRPYQELGYGSGKGAACERRAGLSLSGALSATWARK